MTGPGAPKGNQNRKGRFLTKDYWPTRAWLVLDPDVWYTAAQIYDIIRCKYPVRKGAPGSAHSLSKLLKTSKKFQHKYGRGPIKTDYRKGYKMKTILLFRTNEHSVYGQKKGVDWAKRVWAIAKFGVEYTASQLYTKMVCGPWPTEGAPIGANVLSKILQECGYFDSDYKYVSEHGNRNVFVKRRLY